MSRREILEKQARRLICPLHRRTGKGKPTLRRIAGNCALWRGHYDYYWRDNFGYCTLSTNHKFRDL